MQSPETQDRTSLSDILHPPDYRPRALHVVLVITELLGRISPLMLTPAWLALAAIASWPWGGLRAGALIVAISCLLVDGLGLALLPYTGRSFGAVTPPLLALTLLRTAISLTGGLLWGTLPGLVTVTAVQLVIAGISLYATWVEPFNVHVTEAALQSSKLHHDSTPGSRDSVRILHISDLHVEHITPRERQLLSRVEELNPDLTVLTGDYLNLSSVRDENAQADARDLLDDICARSRGPVYAITGSPPVDLEGVVPEIFEGLEITWLLDEVACVEISHQTICLIGLRCSRERSRDAPRLRRVMAQAPENGFKVLLYHSPDLMPEAVNLGVDLYLCGHTHGGQLRLPVVGALVTSSAFWKRYEMGKYEEGETTLYVSRGLGMEGLGAPRARFLAPPEVIVWTLSPE